MKAFIFFILFFLFIGYLIFLTNYNKIEGFKEDFKGQCGVRQCGNKKLLPIMNPKFNLREISKNCILLEDHLFQKEKQCKDCIKKHFLTIEALAEEMITLDKKKECKEYYQLPQTIRKIERSFINGKDTHTLAQEVREIRKELMNKCFNEF